MLSCAGYELILVFVQCVQWALNNTHNSDFCIYSESVFLKLEGQAIHYLSTGGSIIAGGLFEVALSEKNKKNFNNNKVTSTKDPNYRGVLLTNFFKLGRFNDSLVIDWIILSNVF